jgi:hypothetical protein
MIGSTNFKRIQIIHCIFLTTVDLNSKLIKKEKRTRKSSYGWKLIYLNNHGLEKKSRRKLEGILIK